MSDKEPQDDSCIDSNDKKTLTNIPEVEEKTNADTSSQKKLNNEKTSSAIDSNKTDIRENLVYWYFIYIRIYIYIYINV